MSPRSNKEVIGANQRRKGRLSIALLIAWLAVAAAGFTAESVTKPNNPVMDPSALVTFGEAYTEAWCSQNSGRVAEFFAENGSLTINSGEPSAHIIHHRAVARGRQVLWPGRFATESTGSVLACTVRMLDRAKRPGRGAWRLRSRHGGE